MQKHSLYLKLLKITFLFGIGFIFVYFFHRNIPSNLMLQFYQKIVLQPQLQEEDQQNAVRVGHLDPGWRPLPRGLPQPPARHVAQKTFSSCDMSNSVGLGKPFARYFFFFFEGIFYEVLSILISVTPVIT